MKVRIFLIGLLVVCGIGVSGIRTAAAQPAGPPAGYKIEEKYTKTSPDGAITIEQYVNKDTDDWPANRYLLITLWGEADIKGRKPIQTSVVHDWRCRYDLQTGKFDVPALFSDDNAKAVVPK